MNRTKRQLLLKAAKLWDNAKPDSIGHYRAAVTTDYTTDEPRGICGTLWALADLELATFEDVNEVLSSLPPKNNKLYCWGFTKASAKARAAWCRRQASLLAKKKVKQS